MLIERSSILMAGKGLFDEGIIIMILMKYITAKFRLGFIGS